MRVNGEYSCCKFAGLALVARARASANPRPLCPCFLSGPCMWSSINESNLGRLEQLLGTTPSPVAARAPQPKRSPSTPRPEKRCHDSSFRSVSFRYPREATGRSLNCPKPHPEAVKTMSFNSEAEQKQRWIGVWGCLSLE